MRRSFQRRSAHIPGSGACLQESEWMGWPRGGRQEADGPFFEARPLCGHRMCCGHPMGCDHPLLTTPSVGVVIGRWCIQSRKPCNLLDGAGGGGILNTDFEKCSPPHRPPRHTHPKYSNITRRTLLGVLFE